MVRNGRLDSNEKGDMESDGEGGRKSKRARTKTQPFQSSDMDVNLLRVIKATAAAAQQVKVNEDKLAVFFKGEFLAVRNAEGGFYICQVRCWNLAIELFAYFYDANFLVVVVGGYFIDATDHSQYHTRQPQDPHPLAVSGG